jgi:GNAT superfamily N-acetyltransferase
MNMQVRQAEITDLHEIDAFDVFSGDRGPEILRGDVIVAVEAGEVLGYLMHNRNFYHRPFVWFVCVKKSHHRKGVARLLFAHVEAIYAGEPLLFSSTEDDNMEMLNFFKAHGYQPSGAIDNLQKQAELIFVKKLSP